MREDALRDLEASIALDAAFDDSPDVGYHECPDCDGTGFYERYGCDEPRVTCETCQGVGWLEGKSKVTPW